jgi:hypothetical protein
MAANATPLSRPAAARPPTSALTTKKIPTQPYAPTPLAKARTPANAAPFTGQAA